MSLSVQDAALLKAAKANAAAATRGPKIWNYGLFPNPQAATDFVNLTPAQGAGEACFSVRDNGEVDTFYYM